jgi:SAM-dependent methyltransferase
MIDADIQRFYAQGRERDRLAHGSGVLELARTQELLGRYLPHPPADIMDVGGGPGVYAAWLARAGHRVHLIDPVPLHVAQAEAVAAEQPAHPFTVALGDARTIEAADASFDVVLCLGPLYHLPERTDRLTTLRETHRLLRAGGFAFMAAVSRFATLLDSVRQSNLDGPEAMEVVEATVRLGRNWNPGLDWYPSWFTTSYFHLPDELAGEIAESGLVLDKIVGVEGPGGFVGEGQDDPDLLPHLMRVAGLVEEATNLLGLSPHLLAIARKAE